jgi:hypothetical protein
MPCCVSISYVSESAGVDLLYGMLVDKLTFGKVLVAH